MARKEINPKECIIQVEQFPVAKVTRQPWCEYVGDSDVGKKVWLVEVENKDGERMTILDTWLQIPADQFDLTSEQEESLRKQMIFEIGPDITIEIGRIQSRSWPQISNSDLPEFVRIVEKGNSL